MSWDLDEVLASRLFVSAVIALVLLLLRVGANHLVNQRTDDARVRYRWRTFITYTVALFGIFLIGPLWVTGIRSAATFLGLVSAGLAVALREPVTNLAGWAFIVWRRPFHVGDRIEIGDHAGDVIDIRIFQFTLLEIGNWVNADQSTGRVLHVPNGKIFTETLANYSGGFDYIWNEIPVLITFESDWEKAKRILQAIADEQAGNLAETAQTKIKYASRRFLIYYSKLTPTVYTSVDANGVLLTIRYLCEPRRRRATSQAIWEAILRAFAAHVDLDLAYPTQRLYIRPPDGAHPGISAPEAAGARPRGGLD